jgi:hypothetical protein
MKQIASLRNSNSVVLRQRKNRNSKAWSLIIHFAVWKLSKLCYHGQNMVPVSSMKWEERLVKHTSRTVDS